MFNKSTLAKLVLLGAMILGLSLVLLRIDWLVSERQHYQREAIQSVAQSLAGPHTLLGPVLARNCRETFEVQDGVVKRQQTRDVPVVLAPAHLSVQGMLNQDARHRGIFKVNAYAGHLTLKADWTDLSGLQGKPERPNGDLKCGEVTAWVSVSDARGLRRVGVTVNGKPMDAKPGTDNPNYRNGFRVALPGQQLQGALSVELDLELVGTERFDVVPAATNTKVKLTSNWPHPSFDGRFLPVDSTVNDQGFDANWLVSELASSAGADIAAGRPLRPRAQEINPELQPERGERLPVDTLGFALLDPVNPYVMSDRAIKYGLLFIVLTFVCVGLVEVLARRRVHPVQYLLVGLALSVFYLLLLSLSEHLKFEVAYAVAASGAAVLLTHYAAAMLGTWRRGLAFGLGIVGLYGMLFVLLKQEQAALAIGAVLLFAVLAVVMTLTRRLDWYGLGMKAAPSSHATGV